MLVEYRPAGNAPEDARLSTIAFGTSSLPSHAWTLALTSAPQSTPTSPLNDPLELLDEDQALVIPRRKSKGSLVSSDQNPLLLLRPEMC